MPRHRKTPAPRPRAAAAPAARPACEFLPPGWFLRLNLNWDTDARAGWVWGDVHDPSDGDTVEVPAVELRGDDVEDDIIELLRAIAANRAGVRAVSSSAEAGEGF